MEAALLIWAQLHHADDCEAGRAKANFSEVEGSRLFPFPSARKRMSVLVTVAPDIVEVTMTRQTFKRLATWTLYHKGAVEMLLKLCTKYLDSDGAEKKMTPAKEKEFEGLIKDYATNADSVERMLPRKLQISLSWTTSSHRLSSKSAYLCA